MHADAVALHSGPPSTKSVYEYTPLSAEPRRGFEILAQLGQSIQPRALSLTSTPRDLR
jgi:hypothetical protein